MTERNGEEFLNPSEASNELGVNVRTLDRYAREGLITKHKQKITGRVMYKRSEIADLKVRRSQIEPEN